MAKFPKAKIVEEEPPKPGNHSGNLHKTPRSVDDDVKKPLQFKVPESVFNEFSVKAHEEFGHKKGAKLELFLAMWKQYSNNS